MARPDLADELTQQVQDSVKQGAKVELHGGQSKPGTALFRPMILSNIKPQRAYSEELFGPVALVFEARNADHAIQLANDSRFGLGASSRHQCSGHNPRRERAGWLQLDP